MIVAGIPARYGVFTGGLVFTALGIALITKAGLGASPVASLAYVLTFLFPLSLGTFTFLVNSGFLLAQAVLLGRSFRPVQLLQLPATLVFSACIDMFLFLLSFWEPTVYAARIAVLLVGCSALGFGIALQVAADVLILPGEGIVKVIAQKFRLEFGVVKTVFDLSLLAAAAAISLCGLGRVAGIREGTLVAALIVGGISRFCRLRVCAWWNARTARQPSAGMA